MPLVLLRVDERLIHGQVIVGWGGPLRIERIVVADDALAESDWEQDLYRLGAPAAMQCEFVSVAAARECMGSWQTGGERVAVLLRDVNTLARLGADGVLAGQAVNLGGIHHASGRERVLPYLFLNPAERGELAALARSGAEIAARDLPGAQRVPLDELLAPPE
jgi:PTS system mannose-specific IIB component/fructoselysine and glucoselysine-specific PTS system IIB component